MTRYTLSGAWKAEPDTQGEWVLWRDVRDADGSARYGRELDVSARLALDARWAVEIKGARFDGAQAAFAEAQPELMRAAGKGVLHANTASRKVSRLAQRVKALSA